ncbi:MAG TPA: maltose ABC transporter substrate-binding protein [Caproicibacter sp.]|nr:maltose ABC transporter substrate-binding protein [Caproicibacter sp.]
MKRLSAILFAILMIFSVAGCSGNQKMDNQDAASSSAAVSTKDKTLQPEKDAKPVIWEDNDDRITYLKSVAKEFKKKYGIDVKIEKITAGELFNRMVQDAPVNLGPDLFEMPHDSLGNFIAAGLVQPNDNTAEKIKNDFIDSATKCVTYDGQIYGYPLSINTYALFYNKKLVSKPAATFQEIMDFAKKYNNPKENKYAFMWQLSNTYFTHCFLAGYGAYVFGNDGSNKNDIGLNSSNAVEGVKFVHSLKNIMNVKSADASSEVIDGLFTGGKLPYTINGLWAVSNYKKAGVDFGVAVLPKMPNGKHAVSFLGVQALFVSAYAKYPNAAKLFAEMASSKDLLMERYQITHEIPPIKNIENNAAIKSDPYVTAFLQQAQYSTVMPSIPQMNLVWDPYMRALQSVWDKDMDPKSSMDNCVNIIKSSIAAQK